MKNPFVYVEGIRTAGARCRSKASFMLTLIALFALSGEVIAQQGQGSAIPQSSPAPILASALPGSSIKPATSAEEAPLGVIKDVMTAEDNGDLVVTILADRPMEHQEFMVDNPSRLVIDFTNAENRVPFWQLPVNHAHVRRLRVAQFQDTEPKIARVVFDLDEGYGKHEIERDAGSLRIRFESGAAESASNVGQSAAPAKTSAAPVPPSQAKTNRLRLLQVRRWPQKIARRLQVSRKDRQHRPYRPLHFRLRRQPHCRPYRHRRNLPTRRSL
jgi:hypothetical protein